MTDLDAAAAAEPIRTDPRYAQALRSMQRGEWRQAAEAVAALERTFGACEALRELQRTLALRLSVEESWSEEERRREATCWRVARRAAASRGREARRLAASAWQGARRLAASLWQGTHHLAASGWQGTRHLAVSSFGVPAVRALSVANLLVYLGLGLLWLLAR